MKKKTLIVLIVFLMVGGYFILDCTSQQTQVTQQNVNGNQNQQRDLTHNNKPISSVNDIKANTSLVWKTYTNQKVGITFQYPSTWIKNGKDVEAINISGITTAINMNFIDSVSKTSLLIEYYLPPNGCELYKYSVSQYNSQKSSDKSKKNQITVSGNQAIETNNTLSVDGRGRILNPALRIIVIDFLDKNQTGGIEMQFKTPLPDDIEVAKFKQLLSTFKFTN